MRALPPILLLALSPGCRDKSGDSTSTGGICDASAWGPLLDSGDGLTVVTTSGDDAATGSADAPLATLDQAISSVVAAGGGTILIGSGEFSAHALVETDGISIFGCGTTETTLIPADASTPDYLLRIAPPSQGSLGGFSTEGGRRAIRLEGGAAVDLTEIEVDDSVTSGILILGTGTYTLKDVYVRSPVADTTEDSSVAYGMSISGGDVSTTPHISMEGGGFWDSTGVALLAETATVDLSDVEIADTQPEISSGESILGRGVQTQGGSTLSLDGCTITGNSDAGVFAVETYSVVAGGGTVIDGTLSASIPDLDEGTGDGFVVRRGDGTFDPSFFEVSLDGIEIDGNDRAGLVLEDVTLEQFDSVSGSNGYATDGVSWYAQGDTDASIAGGSVVDLEEALPLNVQVITPDEGLD